MFESQADDDNVQAKELLQKKFSALPKLSYGYGRRFDPLFNLEELINGGFTETKGSMF